MRLTLILILLLPVAAQADMYKCLDNAGHVTYTNSLCSKNGLKEAKLIPPPPTPAVDIPVALPPSAKLAARTPTSKPAAQESPSTKLAIQKTMVASSGKCAKINDEIGQVMDEMDAARRVGHTSRQEAEWNERLARMQGEKSRMGCF